MIKINFLYYITAVIIPFSGDTISFEISLLGLLLSAF